MEASQLIAHYSYSADTVTFAITLVLFAMFKEALYFSTDENFKIFKRAILLICIACGANLCFFQTCKFRPDDVALIFIFRDIYHIALLSTMYLYVFYLRNMMSLQGKVRRAVSVITNAMFTVFLTLDLISPFTHYGFYCENGLWSDSTYIKPYTVAYTYGLVAMAVLLIFFKDRMIRAVRQSLIFTEAVCVIIDLIENYVGTNTFASSTFLLPALVVLTLLHSKPCDLVTGAMSQDAFSAFVEHNKKKNRSLDFMVLSLSIGQFDDMPKELGRVLYSFWQGTFRNASLFNLHKGVYVLAVERKKNYVKAENDIRNLIDNEFPKYYGQFQIDYKGMVLFKADYINNAEDMDEALEFFFARCEDREFIYPDEKLINAYGKTRYITEELYSINELCDLDDTRVEVYCQPVKNVKTGGFDTAEVLMRLNLPDIGMVFPDQFIPLAESKGYIHTLSKIILNKTCRELKEMLNEGFQIERISVNFAISELRSEDFCNEVLSIIEANKVPYEKIAVELTESQNEDDFNLVQEKVEDLRKYGIKMYLDDFGTGYSNLDRILKLDLDIIKFDRSLLLYADETEGGKHALNHFSEIFDEMDYKILFEGVENDTQEDICVKAHADYLQGYKFSKPIPFAAARKFFELKAAE